ncbi:ABC transporter permease [Dactylosporangium sp. NPDC000244]|uniref:ABC transporter permease n=1 Tax=Dactylosporangium sp. NPDC000244 TaxID=3154365 RepID=UPI00332E95D1
MTAVLRLTLRTARANLTRSLLSSLAVVLGVAFVCGSLMFTDGLAAAMTGRAAEQYRNVDVQVEPDGTVRADESADLAERVRKVPGVRAAEATWQLYFLGLAAADGRKIRGEHRAVNVAADEHLRSLAAAEGRLPSAHGEVALDKDTAAREHLRIGDGVMVSNVGGDAATYTVVGLTTASRGPFDSDGVLLVLTSADVEALAGYPSTTVIVDAADGVPDEELAARISAAVGVRATAHDELVHQAQNEAVGNANTFRTGLLGFAVIAVAMAAFVIANTFTIVLAQRTREIALLRLVGATRRQVFRSVVLEAAVIGLGGSGLGLALGALVAFGLPALVEVRVDPLVSVKTVLVALGVGVGVTVLAALLPARRGTTVAPVAALSDAAVQVARPTGRVRRVFGVLAVAAGLAGLAAATAAGRTEVTVAGTLLTIAGFLLLSPVVVPAVVRLAGRPLGALGGATVALALRNAVRNPRRIATTTNALVVGVTLVGTFTLIAKSAEAPAERRADAKLRAQFLVTDSADFGFLPAGLLDALQRQPQLGGFRPRYETYDQDASLEVHTGAPRPGAADVTADLGVAAGGTVTIHGRPFTVASVVSGTRSVWLTAEDITAVFDDPRLAEVQLDPAAGVSKADARAAIDRTLNAFPAAVAYDHEQYVERLNAQLNQGLEVVTALLAMAVVIALIGVANTLTLSVVERTRENALLRAVGLTRRELRLTLAAEALVLALTGTLIGVAASVAIALSVLGAIEMHGSGLSLVMPWDRLGILLGVAVLAALAAAVLPARRAARQPIAVSLAVED